MIAGEERVAADPDVDLRVPREIGLDRARLLEAGRQARRIDPSGEDGADAVEHHADLDIARPALQQIGDADCGVVGVEDVGADGDAFLGALDRVGEGWEERPAVDQVAQPPARRRRAGKRVECALPGVEVHPRPAVERRRRRRVVDGVLEPFEAVGRDHVVAGIHRGREQPVDRRDRPQKRLEQDRLHDHGARRVLGVVSVAGSLAAPHAAVGRGGIRADREQHGERGGRGDYSP